MYWASKLKRAIGLERKARLPDRFSGRGAADELRRILAGNPAVQDDSTILDQLIEDGDVVFFRRGETLIRQGDQDDHVYFLLAGSVDILLKLQLGSIREVPNQIGELAAIKPGSERSATVIARTDEVAALRVSGAVFHSIYSSNQEFRWRLDVEVATRFRERIAAGQVAKTNVSMSWFFMSLGASAFISAFIWYLSSYLPWSLTTRMLGVGLGGVLSLIFLLLQNPAFFWRRCFGITLFAMIGTLALNHYLAIDASQGLQNLQFQWRAGGGAEESSSASPLQALPFLVVMLICAAMDYTGRR